MEWIQTWMSRIQTIGNAFAWMSFGAAFVAGPIPFIVNQFVLPTLLSWLKTLVKQLFADSESEMVQVLIGLDDAWSDISRLINLIYNKERQDLTIDELLMDAEQQHTILIARIQALPLGFSELFKDCTLPQFMQILQVLAHPRFNHFLAQMPAESNLGDLNSWLHAELDALPTDVQHPMQALQDYQTNHERIAQESMYVYRNIKQKYTLRIEDLRAHRREASHPTQTVPPVEPTTFWMFLYQIQWVNLLLTYALLLLTNFCLFGFGILYVTGFFVAWVAAPKIYEMMTNLFQTNTTSFPNDIIPPFEIAPVTEQDVAMNEDVPSVENPSIQSNQKFASQMRSFFGKITEYLPSLASDMTLQSSMRAHPGSPVR
jgi:hypothetical protein